MGPPHREDETAWNAHAESVAAGGRTRRYCERGALELSRPSDRSHHVAAWSCTSTKTTALRQRRITCAITTSIVRFGGGGKGSVPVRTRARARTSSLPR